MNRRRFLQVSLAGAMLASTLSFAPAAFAQDQKDIVDTAIGAGSFKTLVAAVQAAGLVETLKGPGPFTVFAPTDEAFAKLPAGTVENLLKPENKDQLVAVLTYHVVAGSVKAADVVKLTSAKTVNGADVKITVADGKVKVNDANVVTTDIMATNGVIHVIDAVILPPAAPAPALPQTGAASQAEMPDIVDTAIGAGNFKTLAAALTAAGLVDTLKGKGPFTVFAPTDEAFAKLPAGTVESLLKPENKDKLIAVLTYHVAKGSIGAATVAKHSGVTTLQGSKIKVMVDGDSVMLNNANVTAVDIKAKNGIIHVIDSVLLPPGDIVEVATAAGTFKTLIAALEAAGLTDAVKSGKLTVFAPTDEAFAKLPAGTVESLLKPENKAQLVKILTYHVVRKDYEAAQVRRFRSIRTLQGQNVRISRDPEGLNVNNASIVAADIYASNGVIHVIDSVILPR
jgi:transforming growth factor-beta-induced protein